MRTDVALAPNYAEDVFYNWQLASYEKRDKDATKRSVEWQRWDAIYNGFRIQRLSREHSHVHILSLDGSPPPVRLMGNFTAWNRAEKQIDDYNAFVRTQNDYQHQAL